MDRQYKIKMNDKLFNEWVQVSASPSTRLGYLGASIIQNDMNLTTKQLNDWYKEVGESIDETEKHFAEVVKKLRSLRSRTVGYIKLIND